MTHLLFFLLVSHGAIHLLGFAHAFGLMNLGGLPNPISKLWGALWLIACLLMFGTAGLLINQVVLWWALGLLAVLLSQSLVFAHWQEAKIGTVANVLILLGALVGLGQWAFADDNTDLMASDMSAKSGSSSGSRKMDSSSAWVGSN